MMNSPSTPESAQSRENIDVLVSFCKDELAAVETYEKALTLEPLRKHASVLDSCRASHRARAAELIQRIDMLGGKVPDSPGMWGTVAPTLTGAAAAISEGLAVALLEESEDRGLRHYRSHIDELAATNRQFVLERLLPGQNSTHAALSDLKHSLG
ncbi:MAG TPA: DUF2383 domain-containing protein [Polyangiaceae bacterium]